MKAIQILGVAMGLASCTTPQGDIAENIKGERLAGEAEARVGKHFRYGRACQCANFVAHVTEEAGIDPPAGASMARKWLDWGREVKASEMVPGDVIVTWRGTRYGSKGHILVYVGDGQAVHRPTRRSAVKKVAAENYMPRALGVRRPL